MSHSSAQLRIPAVYMRGGTSKGVFFHAEHLPHDAAARDKLLLRVTGSPDSYGKQIDGLGGATSSTSKVVVISRSSRTDCDIDYLFGAVAIDAPVVDWTGNCGNLTSAVGPFAISEGLVQAPRDGWATVRIWQANIQKRIIAHVQMRDGEVVETGDFELDGVAFPAAEVRLEFLDPGGEDDEEGGAMFPTGNKLDALDVPGVGRVEATLINAGNPAIFVDAAALGLNGTELQRDINNNADVLRRAEAIRSHAAVAMGLGSSAEEVTRDRPHTPKLAFFSPPAAYTASNGKQVAATQVDLLARIFSMGALHHAMTGTGAVGIAVAGTIPGTLVSRVLGGQSRPVIRFGHPSGTLSVGAEAQQMNGEWIVKKAIMSRTARRLMEGFVRVPALQQELDEQSQDELATAR
ncbi:2-methylaconitate cis-trans isomerase PrpF [Cupriavidus sp. RAF12]|uniref:2-methylaconitate cis-trans isomerase PrpF n=1 Tax=Cupriavidus sp. RAF12 TaxID=3233050 RepID=UPI003F91E646